MLVQASATRVHVEADHTASSTPQTNHYKFKVISVIYWTHFELKYTCLHPSSNGCFCSLFRSFIQPATPWFPNQSLRWSLLKKRRSRMVQSMGRREQRTSRPIQTKPHLQAQNRKQQKTSSLKWTLTNCYSDCSVLYLCLSCHSTLVLSLFWDCNWWQCRQLHHLSALVISQPSWHDVSHFLCWIQKCCIILILNGLLRDMKVVSVRWKLLSCCFDGHNVKDCFVQHLLSTFTLRMSDLKSCIPSGPCRKKN